MSRTPDVARDERGRLAAALVPAAWTGLALTAGRVLALVAMERYAHGNAGDLVGQRLAHALPSLAASGLALALGAALAARLARGSRRATSWIAVVASLAFFFYLTGRLGNDRSREIGLRTHAGQLATGALFVGGAVLALLVVGWSRVRRARRSDWASALAPVLLVALAGAVLLGRHGRLGRTMPLSDVVYEVLAADDRWETVAAREDRGPYAAPLCPTQSFRHDGGELWSLVMPPPAKARFRVPEDVGPTWLRARAGIDQSVVVSSRDAVFGMGARFSLTVDGKERWADDLVLGPLERGVGSEWLVIGGAEGLLLSPGDVVELETAWILPDGTTTVPQRPLPVGFGGLMLEQRWERPRERTDAEHPNIVFVVMDTLRADRVTVDGYARPTSPALERLAARGISWRDAYATAPWTWPSTATLLTGLMPEEHGVESEVACWLPSELDTLAEALQQAGYTTAAWSTNPLVGPEKNFEQGFEFFDHARSTFRDGDLVMPAILEWLGTMDGTRFFLYLHLTDPHAPHDPLPASRTLLARDVPTDWDQDRFEERQWALLGGEAHTPQGVLETERVVPKDEQRYTNEIYDACVHTGDHWLGLLLDRIDQLGLAGDTVVVFTSDHGEELFDHGLLGHSHDLHAESIRVPLVIAGPGIPAGERRTAPVSLRHVAPTLARIGGASFGDAPGAARDLVRDRGPEDVFFSTQQGWWNGFRPVSMYGVRRGEFVLHYVPSGGPWGAAPTPGGAVRLFDVAADPEERHDLAAERPELVSELKRAILEHLATLERRRRASRVRAGSATEALLKRLGYAGGN